MYKYLLLVSLAFIGCNTPKRQEGYDYLPKAFKKLKREKFLSETLSEIKFNTDSVKKIPINYHQILNGEIQLSSFIDSVWYVKLETTDKSVIGRISDFRIFDNRIYILDSSNRSILIFSISGDFIKKVNDIGRGPKEHIDIHCFTINQYDSTVLFLDDKRNEINYYSLKGEFLYKESAPFYFNEIEFLKKDIKLLHKMRRNTAHIPEINNYELIKVNRNWIIQERGMKFSRRQQGNFRVQTRHSMCIVENEILYHPMFSNSIYCFSKNDNKEIIQLELGDFGLPENFDHNITSNLFYDIYSDNFVFTSDFVANKKHLFLELESKSKGTSFIHIDRETGYVTYGSKIMKNVINSAMFVMPKLMWNNIMISHVNSTDAVLLRDQINSFKENNIKGVELIGNHLEDIVKETSINDNPILVFSKTK